MQIQFNLKVLLIVGMAVTLCSCGPKSGVELPASASSTSAPTNTFTVAKKPLSTSTSPILPVRGTPASEFVGTLIYRSFSGSDYLYSTNELEGPRAGYFPEEARFGLSPTNIPGTIPLYRCVLNSTKTLGHFISNDPKCEGQKFEYVLGYAASSPSGNLVALKRYVNPTTSVHVNVLPGEEVYFPGWKYEGIQGYVTEIRMPEVVQTPDDGKKYFGFYAGAMDGVGTQNYIPELSGTSNLIFIKSGNFEEKLLECERRGLKATVTFDWLFFDDNFRLRSDYAKNFDAVEPIVRKHLSTIVGFYGQDEPYMNGMGKGLSAAEVYHAQETMGRYLKSKFPTVPIGVIFTTMAIKASRPIFPSFDWYGFDCYSSSMSCEGTSVEWYYDHLNTMLNTLTFKDNKKRFIISVPQAGYRASDGQKKGEQSIAIQGPQYRDIVRRYKNVKVVMPFLWQSMGGTDPWVGARDIQTSRSLYFNFYRDFMSGAL